MYQDYNVVLLRLLWAFRKILLENIYSVFTGKEDHYLPYDIEIFQKSRPFVFFNTVKSKISEKNNVVKSFFNKVAKSSPSSTTNGLTKHTWPLVFLLGVLQNLRRVIFNSLSHLVRTADLVIWDIYLNTW